MNHELNNISVEKDLKRRRKDEKKKISKARQIIGFDYLITLILVNLAPELFLQYVLTDNLSLQIILSLVWYIILPFVGAYLIKLCHFKKLKSYITQENYKKIRNYSILDLAILGFLHIGFLYSRTNLIILIIPSLISYVLSAIYLINAMNKLSKQV